MWAHPWLPESAHLLHPQISIELLETEETLVEVLTVHPRVKRVGVFFTEQVRTKNMKPIANK